MSKIRDLIKKILREKSWFKEDGFLYKFIDIKDNDDFHNALTISVDVTLPRKGQSFFIQKFSDDINEYLNNIFRYTGVRPSAVPYQLEITVDGKKVKRGYIEPEKLVEIVDEISSESIKVSDLEMNLRIYFPKDNTYEISPDINFHFMVDISEIFRNGKEVQILEDQRDKFAANINEAINSDDRLRFRVEEIVYSILEPDVRIQYHDGIYYSVNFYVNKLDGRPVKSFYTDYTGELEDIDEYLA